MANDTKMQIRCTAEEKAAWFEAAGGNREFSSWCREVLSTWAEVERLRRVAVENGFQLGGPIQIDFDQPSEPELDRFGFQPILTNFRLERTSSAERGRACAGHEGGRSLRA
jgi:hypothetical protein